MRFFLFGVISAKTLDMKKINWLDHLVNFVVVITGITVAFQLGNWKEERKQQDLENQYVESFLRDLNSDLSELDTLLKNDSIQFRHLVKVFRLDSTTWDQDSLYRSLGYLGEYHSFDEHNTTFESLTSSGKFEEMWDLQLRMQILDNYNSSYSAVRDIEDYFQKNFDNNVLPFFINQMGYFNQEKRAEQVLDPLFKNILGMQLAFLQQKITATKELRRTTVGLIDSFEKLRGTKFSASNPSNEKIEEK